MVRFRRFRIRSPLPNSPSEEETADEAATSLQLVEKDVDVSQDLLISSTKPTASDGNNSNLRRMSSLKELEHKERQFTAEEQRLQSLLQQVEEGADLNKESPLLKQPLNITKRNKRTNSTGSISLSTADSTSVSLTRTETVQTTSTELPKIPLWKRKLSRIQEKKAAVPDKVAQEVDSSFETAETSRSASPLVVKTEDPPSPVDLEPPSPVDLEHQKTRTGYSIRQAMTEEMAPVEEDEILDAPVGLPRVVFSEVKNDDASILSPTSTYAASSYRPGSGDSVSSLGHDEYVPENPQPDICNVQNLARDVIRGAALLFLECDSQCNDQSLNVTRRPTHG